jgi:pyruvate dehydrogenase E2 component (dihydrolipoamide acetyltransferase)
MPIEVSIPRLGWNMETGTFAGWLKADGEMVRPGDALFRLEGEKATEEIETLDGGVLRLRPDGPKVGDTVTVGAVIGHLLTESDLKVSAAPVSGTQPVQLSDPGREVEGRVFHPSSAKGGRSSGDRDESLSSPDTLPARLASPSAPFSDLSTRVSEKGPPVSPRARRTATRLRVDVSQLTGNGTTGRVRERDVLAVAPSTGVIPHTTIRRITAVRMVASLREMAPVTLNTTVDAANLTNLREQFKAAQEVGGGSVPSYTDFLVKLSGLALQQHPVLTSRWTDAGLVPAERIDIGVAVDTDAGLLVPVVCDVPALGLRALAARTKELIELARAARLSARDMEGGCFTVTNLGAFGIDTFTPIINPPEAAVLGVGRLDRRPVVVGNEIAVREQLSLSLTFDHRVADGAPAARFLQTLARLIENPGPWLST